MNNIVKVMNNIVKVRNLEKVKSLFGNLENNFLLACLQEIMGEVYSFDCDNPKSAVAVLGDFRIFAGEPDENLLKFDYFDYKKDESKYDMCDCKRSDMEIIIPQNYKWTELIRSTFVESFEGTLDLKEIKRYSTFEDMSQFDLDKLNDIKNSIKEGFEILDIDEEIYKRCLENEWSKDLVGIYKNYEDYSKKGIGVVLLDRSNNEIVSGASSYCTFEGGIEIEIDTNEQHRRNGYALICGASIILKCLERGIYPSWDTHNKGSIELAKKLGYREKGEYTAFELYRK